MESAATPAFAASQNLDPRQRDAAHLARYSGFLLTVGVYALAGGAYGMLCFGLGRAGLLPILEDWRADHDCDH